MVTKTASPDVATGPFFRRMTILTAEQCEALGGREAFVRILTRSYVKVEKGALEPLDYRKQVPREAFVRFITTQENAVICRIDDFRFLPNGELIGRVLPDERNYPGIMEKLLRMDKATFRFEPRVIQNKSKTRRGPVTREVVALDFVYL